MSSDSQVSLVYSKNVVEFVAVANEFCHLAEAPSRYPAGIAVDLFRKLLPLLYLKACLLPETETLLEDNLEKFVTELDYNILLEKWGDKLGEYDSYFEVFDPEIQFGSETTTASVSEGLMDIYQDLKDFLMSYRMGNEEVMNDALAECMQHFRDFWGQRLVNILRALHQLWVAGTDWEGEKIIPGAKTRKTIKPSDREGL